VIQCYKKDSKFFLADGEKVFSVSEKLAITFSQDSEFWTLHKIGEPTEVEKYYNSYKEELEKRGLLGKLGNFVYLELPINIDVEEINILLEDPSYLESLLEIIGK
jgi:hypothetical protein